MTHRGEIVEKAVRKSGYTFTKLANKLNISRNTLYNRFADADLDYRFILQVGRAIYHDFTIDFPEITQDASLIEEQLIPVLLCEEGADTIWRLEGKYTKLLERYTKLLSVLIKITNRNEMHQLKNDLMGLIDHMDLIEKGEGKAIPNA